ncbi:MAG: hypothetical protein ABSB57_04760, partial [Dehalococcoidia bacterium]
EAIANLTALVVRARSAVFRDPYRREIDYIPQPESTGRLAKQLASLSLALAVLEGRLAMTTEDYRNVGRVGLDCMPRDRRTILDHLLQASDKPTTIVEPTTTTIAASIGYPTTTVRRVLEDLTAFELVERIPQGQGKADVWLPTKQAETLWEAANKPLETFSEKSTGEGIERECNDTVHADISGKVGQPVKEGTGHLVRLAMDLGAREVGP